MFKDIIIFYFIYVLAFFSYCGFGVIATNKFNLNNIFEKFFFGLIILFFISFILNLFNINYSTINILIFFLGILIFLLNNKNHKEVFLSFILLSILFLGLLISKTHEDFIAYHFQGIINISQNKIIVGEANLSPRIAGLSILAFNQSLLFNNYLGFKLVHLPIYLIFVSSIGYFLLNLIKNNSKKNEKFFCGFIIILLITKFNRLSEYGYDFPSQLFLFVCAHKIIFKTNVTEIYKSVIFFVLSLMIKIVAVFFIPVFLYKYKKIIKLAKNRLNYTVVLFLSTMIIFFSANNFLKTGCLINALNFTCFSEKTVFWSAKKEMAKHSNLVENWTKGFYHQQKLNYKVYKSDKDFKKSFNWVKYWLKLHFFNKISDYLLLCLLIFILVLFISEKKSNNNNYYNNLILIFSLCFFLWFIKLPQFRFGVASLTFFFFYLISFFFKNYELELNIKKFKILFIISILFFNITNLNRIKSEFNRSDQYKFKNFPWFDERNNIFSSTIPGRKIFFKTGKNYVIIK